MTHGLLPVPLVREPCAVASRRRREPTFGTASRVRRWILLEHPGAWGADAVRDSGLADEVIERLVSWRRSLPARVLLIRRTGGRRDQGPGATTLMVGYSAAGASWLEELRLDSVDGVQHVDLTPLADGRSVGGRALTEPRYLVCTNGKHDVCCARDGLPVARLLDASLGDRVWECSHVGGDRFAGNLVCLPEGQFYGHLDPASAQRVVAAHEGGRLELAHWRGSSCDPFPVQAAEALVRQRLDLDESSALRTVRAEHHEGDTVEVRFARRDGGTVRARIRNTTADEPAHLTCGGDPTAVPAYELEELVEE